MRDRHAFGRATCVLTTLDKTQNINTGLQDIQDLSKDSTIDLQMRHNNTEDRTAQLMWNITFWFKFQPEPVTLGNIHQIYKTFDAQHIYCPLRQPLD